NAPTERTVWWSEGVAEYVANQDNNQAAIDTTKDGSVYTLGEVFETTYDGFDQDRIYRWGYLAVRFMFERHQNEVNSMLASTRTGDWAGYKSRVNSWASAYNNEFVQWYQALDSIPGGNVKPVAVAAGPYSGQPNSAIAFDGSGSYDSDGSVNTYSWSFSDGGSASGVNASYTFSSAGSYTATLTVTDNLGLASDPVTASVSVSSDPVGNVLNNGQTISINGAQDSENRFTMDVPAGASDLNFVITGGSGDADLYVQHGSAPTTNTYDCRPWLGGNNETCAIANVQSGTYHVMVRAYNSYSNVSLTGSFTGSAGGNVPDACATSGPVTSGSLVDGEPLCLGNQDPIWLTIGGVNSHSSIAISTGNGTGDIDVHYQNGTWPAASNNDGDATTTGNSECIYLTNTGTDYWGYFKITGNADGASIVVDFDTAGCR
ncbi:MAG: collagenase, partial [Psychrosphaera sp.]|nr:collagenase [Psychrosphaera sp.]